MTGIDLWGREIKQIDKFIAFHDESIPDKRWLLIGITIIREGNLIEVIEALNRAREMEAYQGEIHFCKLPASFAGKFGAKARLARKWIKMYEDGLSKDVWFSCLIIDRQSPKFDRKRFKCNFHEYNRFTAMALKGAIAWHITPLNLDEVFIKFISDAKDRCTRPEQGMVDNFESYIPYRAELDSYLAKITKKRYPLVRIELELKDSSRENGLQFTDLLLGATQMALIGKSGREVKREIGKYILDWFNDIKKPPWKQQYGMHRKFNIWLFPDKDGKASNEIEMQLSQVDKSQLSLF
ncbi:MAG: hypothetical protein QME85_05030 [Candidatus Saccharicenans sp.]|nr:hypothetical protein [Candidatus Saccharicenans sp.]